MITSPFFFLPLHFIKFIVVLEMKKIFFYLIAAIAIMFTSCLGTQSDGLSDNPSITTFSVSNIDTAINLSKIKYNFKEIDQYNSIITPQDSLPYGTKMDSLIVSISGSSLSSIRIFESKDGVRQQEFDGSDKQADTVNFTDTVYIETVSQNKKVTKYYKVKLFAHKQDPELYIWTGVMTNAVSQNITQEKVILNDTTMMWYIKDNGNVNVYTSYNGTEWQMKSLTNFPNGVDLKYMLKSKDSIYVAQNTNLYSSKDGLVWKQRSIAQSVDNLLFELDGSLYAINNTSLKLYNLNNNNWTEVSVSTPSGALPDNFPVSGAGIWSDFSSNGVPRVYIAGGQDKNGTLLNTIWASENGSYWVNLGNNSNLFTPRKDVIVLQYDGKLMLIGGRDNSGVVNTNFHIFSADYGISWKIPAANMMISSLFTPRYNGQAVVRKDKARIYIVSGQASNGTFIKDVWTGVKNGLLWELK